MAVPVSQMYTVTKYVLTQKLRGVKRYPLVLMLEPLFRCNLACPGCGKIQDPDHVLDKRLPRRNVGLRPMNAQRPSSVFRAVNR